MPGALAKCAHLWEQAKDEMSLLWVFGMSPLSPPATRDERCGVLGSSVGLNEWQPGTAVHLLFKRNRVLGIIIS